MKAPTKPQIPAVTTATHHTPHFEVEQKYGLSTALAGAVAAHIAALGFTPRPSVRLSDIYYTDPAHTFIEQRICLRLRTVDNKITSLDYKSAVSQAQQANTHAKQEIELAIANAPLATGKNLLHALGFHEYVTVAKTRTAHTSQRWPGITIDWDVVDSIGIFVELEALVSKAEDIPAAEERLRALAGQLGLAPDMLVGRPYRDLVATALGLAA